MIGLAIATAANMGLSPLDLAVKPDVGIQHSITVASAENKERGLGLSIRGTNCFVGQAWTIDDWNSWD